MRLERKHFLVIVLIASLSITISGQINTAAEKFQNVKVNITEISWYPLEKYTSSQNYTEFLIGAKFQVNNQNNYNITLRMGCIASIYLVNVTWSLDNTSLKVDYYNMWGDYADVESDFTIFQGIENWTTCSKLLVYKLGLTTLPDGEYTFWIYLMGYGETILDSSRSKVIIENGIPTFQYKLTINLALEKNHLILLIIVAAFTMRYTKRRNNI